MENRIKNNVFNGMTNSGICNAHISYRGRSIIVDYEHILHCYGEIKDGFVPVEVYPNSDEDIDMFYVSIDDRFGKADIGEIIVKINEIIAQESNSV